MLAEEIKGDNFPTKEEKKRKVIGLYSLKDLADLKIESVPFLWGTILVQQGLSVLTGPSDSNKSTFLRLLAFAIAAKQEEFLGLKLNVRHGRVIIICSEDSHINMAAVIRKQGGHTLPLEAQENVIFIFETHDAIKKVESIVKKYPADCVILDTWTDLFNDDLNNAIAVRQNLKLFQQLSAEYDFSILCVHHTRKAGEQNEPHKRNVLGSQAVEAVPRSIIDLRREGEHGNKRKLSFLKGNYTPENMRRPLILDLDPETLHLRVSENQESGYGFHRLTEDGKEKFMPAIKDLEKSGLSQDKIVEKLKAMYPNEKTPSKGTINNWLRE